MLSALADGLLCTALSRKVAENTDDQGSQWPLTLVVKNRTASGKRESTMVAVAFSWRDSNGIVERSENASVQTAIRSVTGRKRK
ncbi:hypothetical protein L209DRAFT_750281 [Thermothelomyces heterothallicus CBS 203.75]